ncbi:response regulator transcription factor [Pseudomonas solani]|uniref:response regulator transcription factor n=1 Tax=Pseudomonas solani TaxID=2731552 RepID=UPI003C2EE7BF
MEKLLVVEDAPEIREMVSLYLANAGYEVLETASGLECLRLYDRHQPAAVILDIGLPDIDGLSVAAQLRSKNPEIGIILVTVRDDDFDRVAGLETGADCYITKPVNLRVLLAQIRSLLRRRGIGDKPSQDLCLGPYRVDLLRRRIADEQGADVSLTAGEFALLIGLIERRGKAVSRHDLLACLRSGADADDAGDLRTVDTLVARLRRKLELNSNRPQLIQTVYGKGYKLASESEMSN